MCALGSEDEQAKEEESADLVLAVLLEGFHIVVDILGGEVPEAAAQRHKDAAVQQARQPQDYLLHLLQHWPCLRAPNMMFVSIAKTN